MSYNTLKALVNAKVYENTEQRITGGDMNDVLQRAIASLGAHYQMGGLVSPTDQITVRDEPVVFLATTPGTYTYFGGLVVADGEVALLVWSGTAWSKQTPDISTRTEVNQLGQEINETGTIIHNAEIAFDDDPTSTSIDLLANAITDKYLTPNTASVAVYAGYNISAPIHLLKGQKLSGTIYANDVTVLAETNVDGTTYNNIQNSLTGGFASVIDFVAEKDMYVAICYLASGNNTANIISTDITLSDIARQVKTNETDVAGIKIEIEDADEEFGKEFGKEVSTPIDIVTGAVVNRYLTTNTAIVVPYTGYNISAPIHLLKGQKLSGTIFANDVCLLAETDISASSYTFIQNSVSGTCRNVINYIADKELYIAICYKTNETINNVSIISVVPAVLSDVVEQVKINTNDIEELKSGGTLSIPAFVFSDAQATFARFQKWKGQDECLLFPIMTDLHASPTRPETLKPNDYIVTIDQVFGFNHIANLGDVGLGNDNNPTEEKALFILNSTAKSFNKYFGKYLFVQGNHDSDFKGSLGIGQIDVNNYLACSPFNRFPDDYKVNLAHQCYYVDNAPLKIRIICINTTDKVGGGGYGMTDEQLNWIYATLLNTPDSYNVLVLSHFCVNKIGEWTNYVSDIDFAYNSTTQLIAYAKMLEAFANKTSVNYESYSFDFTGVDASIKLIANICGDSHFDAQLRRDETLSVLKKVNDEIVPFNVSGNGVNYVITQGYGSISVAETPSWATHIYFNPNETVLFDVVAIKPNQNVMKLFRVGAGGSARDREFTF